MLIKTEEVQAKHARRDPAEEQRWRTKQYLLAQIKKAEEFQRLAVTDPERQKGRYLFPYQLEGYLTKLFGDKVHFLVNPHNPSKKALYLKMQDGNHWYICSYENGLMPEYSVMEYKTEWIPDPDADIITETNLRQHGENAVMLERQVPSRELSRGWRTVFVTLILKELVSPEAVERLVGGSERPSWNARTKGSATSAVSPI